jgi:hypothetical protein
MRPWLIIFIVAAAVRALLLASWLVPRNFVVAPYHVEVEAVARSLVAGHGYADPYAIPTGPTAHPLPIQTALQALIYLLFGVTPAAGYARSVAGIASCAASYAMLPWLAAGLGLGRRAGIAGGLAAALLPLHGVSDALGWWGNEALAAIALGVLLVWYLRRWRSPDPPSFLGSLALGGFAGFAFHLAPSVLPVVLLCAPFELWWLKDRRKWTGVLATALGATLVCVPWAWRNYTALHDVYFIRSNFGLELRLANHDGAQADIWTMKPGRLHPGSSAEEAARVRDLGEARYMTQVRDEALTWIGAHPTEFARLTVARAWHVWFGPPARPLEALPVAALTILALLGLARGLPRLSPPERAALVIPLVAYPLVYYLVGYVPRYLFPLSGLLFVLAASEVMAWASREGMRTGGHPAN